MGVVAALMLAAPVSAATLPDAVMSPNVEYLGSIQQDVGLTTGAKVVGDRMFSPPARTSRSTTSPTRRRRGRSAR
jgi:hypothetical protein